MTSPPLSQVSDGFVMLTVRSVTNQVYVSRSRKSAALLRRMCRHSIGWFADQFSVTPEQVVAVIASDEGCRRSHCEMWAGAPWVRASSAQTRKDIRGAASPPTYVSKVRRRHRR